MQTWLDRLLGRTPEMAEEKKLGRFKTQFMHIVTHEINQPLTVIKWAFTELKDKIPAVEGMTELRDAEAALARLFGLSKKVVEILRLEEQEPPKLTTFDAGPEIEKIVDGFQKKFGDKKLYLKYEIYSPLSIYGDAQLLTTAVGEILENALKFTEHGGVEISEKVTESSATIVVKDTGIGITKKRLLFKKFVQIDRGLLEKGGLGAGLYLAYLCMRTVGGTISYRPNPEGGSIFELTFLKKQV